MSLFLGRQSRAGSELLARSDMKGVRFQKHIEVTR